MFRIVRALLPLCIAVGAIYSLDRSWGSVPPLGKLFSPFTGFLQNLHPDFPNRSVEWTVAGLKAPVSLRYDDNGVPHIFAESDEDLYFAQGFVVAKDRLWQMEFYTLAASGRLTEIVGEAAYDLDRYHRRIGMASTAKSIVDNLKTSDSLSWSILESYAAGVNAYIQSIDDTQLPVEYKLLNYRPEPWSPYKSILMLMNMRLTLSGGTDDLRLTNAVKKYGMETIRELFPQYPRQESPIIPSGTKWGFEADFPQGIPELKTLDVLEGADLMPAPAPQIGSNNWAVAGSKTAHGFPMLSNDPHLGLSLPSIWYQIQLSTPNSNVCGVALPGTPAVIIGFNKNIAWGVTNVGSDVMDFYQIRFQDSTKQAYWHDGEWKFTRLRVDTHYVKGAPYRLDSVFLTHHGPVVHDGRKDRSDYRFPKGHAMRWAANQDAGSDLLTFYYLNRAKDYDDYRFALSLFTAPAQNFVFASNADDIAITVNGRLPKKWREQGRFLMDGTDGRFDWQGWIPFDQNPHIKNPSRSFVSSANQFPADTIYPYYLDWNFSHPTRAIRINERLAEMHNITVDSFRTLLNDNLSVDGRRILPTLMNILQNDPTLKGSKSLAYLRNWDCYNDAESIGATIFNQWFADLYDAIWDDDFPASEGFRGPSLDKTIELLLSDAPSNWFDDTRTPDKVESRQDIVITSYHQTIGSLVKKLGEIGTDSWRWAAVKKTRIAHLVPNFTSFGRTEIWNGGHQNSVNATSVTHGPSWRMVVQLDPDWPKAYGLYPGGQSGNPASPLYDNMIDKWAKGELNELVFLKDASEVHPAVRIEVKMIPRP